MEPEGITRACTIVPVIRRKASATQSQETQFAQNALAAVGPDRQRAGFGRRGSGFSGAVQRS